MKELSLHILDIAENALRANATRITIAIREDRDRLTFTVEDNGCGMDEEAVRAVTDPFYTTRTTRKVGMGVPLLKLAAEQTGGSLSLTSRPEAKHPNDHGTKVVATFCRNHMDFVPLGDMVSTITALIQGAPGVDLRFSHTWEGGQAVLDTAELRPVLGKEVSLRHYEVIQWIARQLRQQYGDSNKEANSQKG